MLAEWPLILMLLGLAAYVVLSGADFGAGFWDLTARGERGKPIREHTHNAIAPVWEANHVWLIFVLVVCWTAYPRAFGSIASTLAIPLFAALVGIAIRGTSYALHSTAPEGVRDRFLGGVFSISSLLTPFFLGAVIGGIASGRVPVGNAAGDPWTSWWNPTGVLIGVLAVVIAADISAVYLTADAHRIGREDLVRAFRKRALAAGVLAGAVAIAGIFVLHADARNLYDGLTSGGGLACLILSALGGMGTLILLLVGRYEAARLSSAVSVGAIVAGWGFAQSPYILPGLTVQQASAGHNTALATVIVIIGGLVILLPSLAVLFSLVLRGRFDPGAQHDETEAPPGDVRPVALLERPRLGYVLAGLGVAGGLVMILSDGGVVRAVALIVMLGAAAAGGARVASGVTDP